MAASRSCCAVAIMKTVLSILVGLLIPPILRAAPVEADYTALIENWRAQRAGRLTAPDGWLTLTGLHFLQPGENTVGSAPENQIVLASGPAKFGIATLSADGKVSFKATPESSAQVGGQPAGIVEMRPGGEGKPTLVTAGTVSFFVIERGGRMALRVKDSATVRRTGFLGIDYFPVDPSWRIEAQWIPFNPPREVAITNMIGNVSQQKVPGKAVFQRDGRTYELLPIVEGPNEPLFFVISDATSGQETYLAARFLDADPPKDGKVVLDFNRAVNPPCAFTPFATCPLPPKENQLSLAVTAGEKKYRGEHD